MGKGEDGGLGKVVPKLDVFKGFALQIDPTSDLSSDIGIQKQVGPRQPFSLGGCHLPSTKGYRPGLPWVMKV